MARRARKKSNTGFYHVYMRGNDQQELFYDDNDRNLFLEKMYKYANELKIDIYTYTLMDNHVHLEIGNANDTMAIFIKKLACSYVPYFNKKYNRTGHLFQGRYQSEPIEDVEYFLATLGYILNNPLKAGISVPLKYKWNNYKEFFSIKLSKTAKYVINILGSRKNLSKYLQNEWQEAYYLEKESIKGNDKLAVEFIKQLYRINNPSEIRTYELEHKVRIIKELHSMGFSGSQLSRILRICKGFIYRKLI